MSDPPAHLTPISYTSIAYNPLLILTHDAVMPLDRTVVRVKKLPKPKTYQDKSV